MDMGLVTQKNSAVIYGLIDPRTGNVRYVGYTAKSLKKRFKEHLRDIRRCKRTSWIKSLQKQGLVPEVVVLEKVGEKNWQEIERKWIADFGRKNLVNGTDGGDGIVNPSEELRQKRAEVQKGRHHSRETKQKMSEVKRNNKNPMFGKYHSEESRRKISEAIKGEKNRMFGRHLSKETRRKISETMRSRP